MRCWQRHVDDHEDQNCTKISRRLEDRRSITGRGNAFPFHITLKPDLGPVQSSVQRVLKDLTSRIKRQVCYFGYLFSSTDEIRMSGAKSTPPYVFVAMLSTRTNFSRASTFSWFILAGNVEKKDVFLSGTHKIACFSVRNPNIFNVS
jgi:hypothetical protein